MKRGKIGERKRWNKECLEMKRDLRKALRKTRKNECSVEEYKCKRWQY